MIRSLGKFLFRVAAILLWAAVIALALEFGTVQYTKWVRKGGLAYKERRVSEFMAIDEIAMQAIPAPPLPAWVRKDLPLRDSFQSLDEAGRKEYAQQRQELVTICDPAGVIQSLYAPPESPESPELAQLTDLMHVGENVSAPLPPQEGADVRQMVAEAYNGLPTGTREYALPLPGQDRPYACCFGCVALLDSKGAVNQAMIYAKDSKYEVLCQKYRPHVYRNSKYDFVYPQFSQSEFWTNAYGFRSDEIAVPKPPGVYRIVCVGGSTTVEGPRNDLTYPHLLEKRLREHFHTDRIEVVNCGVDALDSAGEVRRIPDYLALQPDLILEYTFANDVVTAITMTFHTGDPRDLAGKKLRHSLSRSSFLYAVFTPWLIPLKKDLAATIGQFSIGNLRQMRRASLAAGADMALCSFAYPDLRHIDWHERNYYDARYTQTSWGSLDIYLHMQTVDVFNEAARRFCEEEGVHYIPLAENLKGGTGLFADIAHLTLVGIQRKADIIFDQIQDLVGRKLAERERR